MIFGTPGTLPRLPVFSLSRSLSFFLSFFFLSTSHVLSSFTQTSATWTAITATAITLMSQTLSVVTATTQTLSSMTQTSFYLSECRDLYLSVTQTFAFSLSFFLLLFFFLLFLSFCFVCCEFVVVLGRASDFGYLVPSCDISVLALSRSFFLLCLCLCLCFVYGELVIVLVGAVICQSSFLKRGTPSPRMIYATMLSK